MVKMIEKKCNYCSVDFLVREAEIKRGYGKYCSRECSGKSRIGEHKKPRPNNITCAHCHTSFYRRPSHLKNSRSGLYFCNRKCKELAQRLGGIKEIMPPHYGTAIDRYPYRKKFNKDELKCERCGYDEFSSSVQIHHIDKNQNNNNKENLMPLCANCHLALHHNHWSL